MPASALFVAQNGLFAATELTRGPWDRGAQHGGAPAALLMHAFEALPAVAGLGLARVTYELLRPVPLAELELRTEVARPGRRVQLLEASLHGPDGVELVRARALQVRGAVAGGQDSGPGSPPAGPEGARPSEMVPRYRPMFTPDAVEIRFVSGDFGGGPATAWFRLRHPVIAGTAPTALQSLAAAADFGNGISSPLSWDEYVFINPDLTLYVERQPVGEWICLQSQTRLAPEGIGLSESVLFDQRGRVGRATQALLVAPR